MKKLVSIGLLLFLLTACKHSVERKNEQTSDTDSKEVKETPDAKKPDSFYHYNIWLAFVNKIYDGTLSAKELKTKGDIALGSYNALDGELIMLDGVLYQITEDGIMHKPGDEAKIAYTNATFFESDQSFDLNAIPNYDSLRQRINRKLPTTNIFYAFKIHGKFNHMKCGGLHKQDKPYATGLDVLIPKRPVFERENVEGTMVGFYCPDLVGDISVPGYHLHFISDDEQFGGHVMEFNADHLSVALDHIWEYHFVLPQTDEYKKVTFEKAFQYKKK